MQMQSCLNKMQLHFNQTQMPSNQISANTSAIRYFYYCTHQKVYLLFHWQNN